MTDIAIENPSQRTYDEEISISELLTKLWNKRGLIVMLPLVLAGLTVAGLLLNKQAAMTQTVLHYYIELHGISSRGSEWDGANGNDVTTRYPNGVEFSPQDLKNPYVIQLVARQLGVEAAKMAQHIYVEFGSPLTNGVLQEYEAVLSVSTSAERLISVNDHYQDRLAATTKRGLKISIDYNALEISKAAGQQLAEELPRAWNKVFTSQYKTQTSPKVMSQAVPLYQVDVTSTDGFLTAENQLKLIEQGVIDLSEDSRLGALSTDNGTTAAELRIYLEDFRSIYFDPLYSNAFGQDSALARLYQRNMQLQIDELSDGITELNNRLQDIRQHQRGVLGMSSSSEDGGGDQTQFDGSALTEVVALADTAALSLYLEQTLNLRSDLFGQRAQLKTKLKRIVQATSGSDSLISPDFLTQAVTRYDNLVGSYGQLVESARAILIAETPPYFSPLSQPSSREPPLIRSRDYLAILIAIVLGGMLAVIAALLWPDNRS